jgi:HlyD family secretion protein
MNSRLFRKTALDRLSSPEELDQIIQVSSSKSWAALLAILLLLSVIIYWTIKGSLPTTVPGRGMIVRTGDVLKVVARGSGVVQSINVSVGMRVKADQVVAQINLPLKIEKLRGMKDALVELGRKQERDLALRKDEVQVNLNALAMQRINLEREISELEEEAKQAKEQRAGLQELFSEGIINKAKIIESQQAVINIGAQVETRKARLKQVDAQEFTARSQIERDISTMSHEIANVESDIKTFEHELMVEGTVVSPYAGEILEVKVSAGSTVAEGEALLTIQPEVETLHALLYVPSSRAKDIREKMEVQITPSSVRREEFGFMQGKVVFIADYPATPAAMMRRFQNEMLVSTLTSSGPITEVQVDLYLDANSANGFKWSSSKGPLTRITNGTFCDAEIVTRRQSPINLLLPMIKEELNLN